MKLLTVYRGMYVTVPKGLQEKEQMNGSNAQLLSVVMVAQRGASGTDLLESFAPYPVQLVPNSFLLFSTLVSNSSPLRYCFDCFPPFANITLTNGPAVIIVKRPQKNSACCYWGHTRRSRRAFARSIPAILLSPLMRCTKLGN